MKQLAFIFLLSGACSVFAQATQPAKPQADEIEMRALQAFEREEYTIALPLLKKTAEALKGQPDRLGPIEEKIRFAEKNLTAGATTKPAAGSLSDGRKPHPAPEAGRVLEMSIKDLGNFDYNQEKGGNIPEDVTKLSGSTIRLSGYMMPIDQAERISRFALMPTLGSCCFGEPAQIQHTVLVTCPPGKAVGYYPDEIVVEGVLTVKEKKEDGFVTSVFQMQTTSVKPAAK